MCTKEHKEVTHCRQKKERRGKKSVRNSQQSSLLLVKARCDLRDKPIREEEKDEERHRKKAETVSK